MVYYDYNKIELSKTEKSVVIYIIQIIALYIAKLMGWEIKKIGSRKYKLSKHIDDVDLTDFLQLLLSEMR